MSLGGTQFQVAIPSSPGAATAELWARVREGARFVTQPASPAPDGSILESGLSPIAVLDEAPSRTIHSTAIMRASPMSSSVRAMIERREFGRRYDTVEVDLASIRAKLPALECPDGDVEFLASDASFDDLSFSVDCILQHRRALLAPSVDASRPRRNVLVLGAGPGGLMAAIELRLRDHRVVVCELREVYTRNRFIGVYKQVAHLMAALGMPERMTYDFTHYRGKRGLMLADIQTFLHGVALKLGVVIYTGALVRDLSPSSLRGGQLELHRATRSAGVDTASAIGMTRWHHDTVTRVRSGVSIRFDTILEATGGRSGLREELVGRENVVSLRTVGRDAALRDPSLDTYFDDPDDHCAQFVESDYGCPPELRRKFASKLLADDAAAVPDELPGLVSNVDASIIVKPVEATARVPGVGARIGDKELDIPRDWVLVRCPLPDKTLTRYQIEGPLPQSFEFAGKRVSTRDYLSSLNPVSLLVRLLYAMGVPFDAVDRKRLVEFYTQENSRGDASDIVAAFVGTFRGLRLGGERPIWCGLVPGSKTVEYGIIGEALQNAWYRFGVGVDDTFAAAAHFAEGFELSGDARLPHALRFERVMTSRSVQVLYHLWLVQQNIDQGVVGPVLTECYMDRRYRADLAEARLREETQSATSMLATLIDLRASGTSSLLEAAVEHRRDRCCRSVLGLLSAFDYDPKILERATQIMRMETGNWRARVLDVLGPVVSESHREVLTLLAQRPVVSSRTAPDRHAHDERLVELAIGRYDWASPWVRACALRALDPGGPGAAEVLARAIEEKNELVSSTARAVLAAARSGRPSAPPVKGSSLTTIDKVVLLEEVSIFGAIPHEELADVAGLLSERWASAGERIVEKGELGECLYVIASGSVEIHDGRRPLARLGKSRFFGELSLLDTEPRSASVTATEDTHLFQLGQADLYALIAERPQIVHAINRGLCKMVRGMLESTSHEPPTNPTTTGGLNMSRPSYAHGLPTSPLIGKTMGETLREVAAESPNAPALVVRHQSYRVTYRELWDDTTKAAKALLAGGVARGDRVAIWAPNRFEWTVLQYATARIGAIMVCVNPGYTAEGVEHALKLSGTNVLFTATTFEGRNFPSIVADARPRLPELRGVVELDAGWRSFLDDGAAVSDAHLAEREASVDFDDPVNIQFTSGSTGRPKGVTLTHFGLLNNARNIGGRMNLRATDRACCPAQYFHIMANTLGALSCLTHGACLLIPSDVYDPISTLEMIQEERATAYIAVPTMYIGVLNHPRFGEFDVSSLRTGIMAGAPCPIEVMRRVETELHMPEVTICYGMTEMSPVFCQTRIDAPTTKRVETVGEVHPHVEIKIIDLKTGAIVPRGVPGEFCSRGYSLMPGYWREPEATAKAIDGARWMHTGDLAVMDDDGFVQVKGRIKEIIQKDGKFIFPRDIEEVLFRDGAVADVQVFGVPDKDKGEEIMAWVRCRPGQTTTQAALEKLCASALSPDQMPRYWRFVDEFPTNMAGKNVKYMMQEEVAAGGKLEG